MKLGTISFTLVLIIISSQALSAQSLSTVAFDAEINDSQIVNAEVSSYLDNQNHTHIAWIKQVEDTRTLVYTEVDNEGKVSSTDIRSYPNGTPVAPQITVDNNGGVHIVYIVKRDNDASRNTGNYAIMYAGLVTGSTFEQSQVSTNPDDPSDDTESEFDAYVNGRPTITVTPTGGVKVYYTTNSYSENGYENQLAEAEYSNGNWNRSINFSADGFVEGTFDIDEDFIAPAHEGSERYLATIDISDYRPQFFKDEDESWSKTILEEYGGVFDNSDIRLVTDNDGATYMLWMNETDDDERFVYTQLDGTSYAAPVNVVTEETPAGNLFGYTIDRTTTAAHFFYNRSFNSNSYLITVDEQGNSFETEIPDLGAVYGKRALHANNGFISLVTASESRQQIFVTTGNPSQSGTSNEQNVEIPSEITLQQNYPNPFNPTTVIGYKLHEASEIAVRVYDMLGREIRTLVDERKAAGSYTINFDAAGIPSGTYIYSLETARSKIFKQMVVIK